MTTGPPVTLDTRILLAVLWVALMLSYLLGDVLRIFSGDFTPGEIAGIELTGTMWLGVGILMSAPIVMVVLSVTLPYGTLRWLTIGVAAFFFLFNLVGLPTYPSHYDRYLNVLGLALAAAIAWYAWHWKAAVG